MASIQTLRQNKARPDKITGYRARLDKDPVTGREPTKHFTTKTAAQAWIDDQKAKQRDGTYVDPRRTKETFRAFYEEWSARQIWKLSSVTSHRTAVNVFGEYAQLPLGALTQKHGEMWVKSLSDKGLKESTITNYMNRIRRILMAAVREKKLGEDPFSEVKLPRDRRKQHRLTIPTPKDVAALIGACTNDAEALQIQFGAFAGLRRGEIAALREDDFDLATGTLKVQRQRPHGEDVRLPKFESERSITLPDPLVLAVKKYLLALPPREEKRWLFPSPRTWVYTCIRSTQLNETWNRLCEQAKLQGFHLHDLRHFYASGLINAGCDVLTVQHALGHSSATVTLGTYGHLWPTSAERVKLAAGQLMAACAA